MFNNIIVIIDAILLSKREAVEYQLKRAERWKPQSQMY